MKNFKNYYKIKAPPADVYRALTFSPTIELWSGHPAVMSADPGSEFSLFDGNIVGRNIEFEQDRKIVQQWYFQQSAESVVTILLHPVKNGTSVELRHTNIPDDRYTEFTEGWDEIFFGSLQAFYEGD